MKKQFLLGLMAMMMGFTACKKDLVKTPGATADKAKQKINVVDPGTVVELTLAPRQPGENFDTYLGNWGGVNVKMQGTPVWDHDRYPNLVNGVPCMGQGYSVGGQNQITTSNAGGQDFFIVYVATASFDAYVLNFTSNVASLASAYNNMLPNSPIITMPVASDFVKVTYGGNTGYVAVTGKLIRITSGTSHFAFATVGYPTPTPVITSPPNTYEIGFTKTYGTAVWEYDISITNGVATSVTSFNIATGDRIPCTSTGGTFTPIAGTSHYHINNIHIIPANTFPAFDFTGDSGDLN